MGPRPIDRGNVRKIRKVDPVSVASMGPRPIDRGNEGLAGGASNEKVLQWGRDRSIAEILASKGES